MEPIVLAHESPFEIGPAVVRPATRTLVFDNAEIVLEPRVMQLLVALTRANGAVVTRDELIESCWDGRVVGEDAINRALSRLRRHAAEAGLAFRIETIARVGYRLARTDAAPGAREQAGEAPSAPRKRVDRRALLAAGGTAVGLMAAGGLWYELRPRALPPAALAALENGRVALGEGTPDQDAAAVAAFRRATELAPDAAETWGQLALGYRQQLTVSGAASAAEAAQLESRARAAIARALAIDAGNVDGLVARALLNPFFRRWLAADLACRPLLARAPAHGLLNLAYGILMFNVGRGTEAIDHYRKAVAALALWPQAHMRLANSLWASGQLDQADVEMERAFARWPRHYSVWFSRQRMLTYTGRGPAALAMLADKATRPIAIPEWNFAMTEAETRAITTRDPADIELAARMLFDAAHRAVGFAANAIVFNAVVGRLDSAFALLDAYLLDRGFTIGPQRYSQEQGMYVSRRDRDLSILFVQETAPLRADSRFAVLSRAVGLDEYWQRSGKRPDFRS